MEREAEEVRSRRVCRVREDGRVCGSCGGFGGGRGDGGAGGVFAACAKMAEVMAGAARLEESAVLVVVRGVREGLTNNAGEDEGTSAPLRHQRSQGHPLNACAMKRHHHTGTRSGVTANHEPSHVPTYVRHMAFHSYGSAHPARKAWSTMTGG